MVIDTGVSLSHMEIKQHVNPKLQGTSDYIDLHSHGTHIAGILLKDVCPEVELISCKYFVDDDENAEKRIAKTVYCFMEAKRLNVDLVNYSSSGPSKYEAEYLIIRQLIQSGTKVVVASGNNFSNLKYHPVYPASYNIKGLIVVGNLNPDGSRNILSNYGLKDMSWEIGTNILSTLPKGRYGYMTGSSQATAIKSNKLIKDMCAHNF